jgi:DNA-binding CsgD family transcriptional regulator
VEDLQLPPNRSGDSLGSAPHVRLAEDSLPAMQQRMDALLRILKAASSLAEPSRIYARTIDEVLLVSGLEVAALFLRDSSGTYRLEAHRALTAELLRELLSPKDRVTPMFSSYEHLTSPMPFRNSDLAVDLPAELRFCTPQKGACWVPLRFDKRLLGFLCLATHVEAEWGKGELSWLAVIGRLCGMVIHQARVAERFRQAEVARERERVGQELRDSIAQALGYSAMRDIAEPEQSERVAQTRAQAVELSPREKDVLRGVASGASNQEIGAQLYLSEHTIKKHLGNILTKLNMQNRVQAAVYAAQEGLLNDEEQD